jgi:hypothetical protein
MKPVLLSATAEFKEELKLVINASTQGTVIAEKYYALDWTSRPGARSDPAFSQ